MGLIGKQGWKDGCLLSSKGMGGTRLVGGLEGRWLPRLPMFGGLSIRDVSTTEAYSNINCSSLHLGPRPDLHEG